MRDFINHNGNILPRTPVLGLLDRTLRYGEILFESLSMIHGELKFLDLHALNLKKSLTLLKFKGAGLFTPNFLAEQINKLAKSVLLFDHAVIHICVYRETSANKTFKDCSFAIYMEPRLDRRYELNNHGLIIDLYTEILKPATSLSSLKSANGLLHAMADCYRLENDLDDCILLNEKGRLAECLRSNIFLIKNNALYTPSLKEGCVDGIMRRVILNMAMHSEIKSHEVKIKPEALLNADEIFLTNASCGIIWVTGFRKKRYFNSMTKQLVEMLNKFSL